LFRTIATSPQQEKYIIRTLQWTAASKFFELGQAFERHRMMFKELTGQKEAAVIAMLLLRKGKYQKILQYFLVGGGLIFSLIFAFREGLWNLTPQKVRDDSNSLL